MGLVLQRHVIAHEVWFVDQTPVKVSQRILDHSLPPPNQINPSHLHDACQHSSPQTAPSASKQEEKSSDPFTHQSALSPPSCLSYSLLPNSRHQTPVPPLALKMVHHSVFVFRFQRDSFPRSPKLTLFRWSKSPAGSKLSPRADQKRAKHGSRTLKTSYIFLRFGRKTSRIEVQPPGVPAQPPLHVTCMMLASTAAP